MEKWWQKGCLPQIVPHFFRLRLQGSAVSVGPIWHACIAIHSSFKEYFVKSYVKIFKKIFSKCVKFSLKTGWHSLKTWVKFDKKLCDILLKVMWKSQNFCEILSKMCVQYSQKWVKFYQNLPEILLKIGWNFPNKNWMKFPKKLREIFLTCLVRFS